MDLRRPCNDQRAATPSSALLLHFSPLTCVSSISCRSLRVSELSSLQIKSRNTVIAGFFAYISSNEHLEDMLTRLKTWFLAEKNFSTKKQKAVRALADKSVSVFSDQIWVQCFSVFQRTVSGVNFLTYEDWWLSATSNCGPTPLGLMMHSITSPKNIIGSFCVY